MSRFKVTDLSLAGLKRIQRQNIGDHRGFLSRLFCADELTAAGWIKPISQINHTYTKKRGTVRGLHFQYPPHAEMKLVTCIRGNIWDVAVDLRANSPTFLHWHAEELSAENGFALLIPEGFGHGFQALTDDAEIIYCVSSPYSPENESGLRPTDPRLSISWPLNITELSTRDAGHELIRSEFQGVKI